MTEKNMVGIANHESKKISGQMYGKTEKRPLKIVLLFVVQSDSGALEAKSCNELKCRHGSMCQMDNGRAQCVCPDCPPSAVTSMSVCGTDGKTYGSECQLLLFACRLQQEISLAHQGACRGKLSTAPPLWKVCNYYLLLYPIVQCHLLGKS